MFVVSVKPRQGKKWKMYPLNAGQIERYLNDYGMAVKSIKVKPYEAK
jgi:hypothetical protein